MTDEWEPVSEEQAQEIRDSILKPGIQFSCCFCLEKVAEETMVRIVASVPEELDDEDDEVWQQWWAHASCFRDALHQGARSFREEFEERILE